MPTGKDESGSINHPNEQHDQRESDGRQGEPLIGANVTYKGATYGAITDINGEFSLPKKEGYEILTAHYIGYNPVSIPADTSKTMLIAMSENKTTLNEVVVTGYGAQKKVAVTGAISTVSIKDLKKLRVHYRNQIH